MWQTSYRIARRIVIAVIGSTVVLLGVVLLVTPFPAVLVIAGGLGILAIEFAWARRWLQQLKDHGTRWRDRFFSSGKNPPPKPPTPNSETPSSP